MPLLAECAMTGPVTGAHPRTGAADVDATDAPIGFHLSRCLVADPAEARRARSNRQINQLLSLKIITTSILSP